MPGGFSYRFLRSGKYLRVTMTSPETYATWTREELVARLMQLDRPHPIANSNQPRQQKPFDFAAYPRRKIALKFSYNGSEYSGLEFQKTPTNLPTVEGVLYDALVHTRLIDPDGGFEGCGWEKCGRTDRGVSAAGQVISLWVRSAFGAREGAVEMPKKLAKGTEEPKTVQIENEVLKSQTVQVTDDGTGDSPGLEGDFGLMGDWDEPPTNAALPPPKPEIEFRYVSWLNNILPPTIRVIAWSPVSADFSARFSCRYRHYKYFFSPHGLDVSAMQDAARRLVGEHDFRNLCKIDASKQLTTFVRRIISAQISRVGSADDEDLCVLDLIGTAFLYNQVRHIMAVLFLVGTRLEHPSVINALLNVDPAHPLPSPKGEEAPLVVTSKPEYQMADPLPLMLWECGYDESLRWRVDSETESACNPDAHSSMSHRDLANNLYHGVQSLYERSVIHTTLDKHFLRAVGEYHRPPPQHFPLGEPGTEPIPRGAVLSTPLGAGTYRRGANYVPLLKRPRMDLAEVVNERWRVGKGARQMERRAQLAVS
ncbi:hypothetical protein AcV5_010182 [Taiwanofungus camphoratus]|nr:hypothetical protein AcV5_010182 [Antrodia cinnamomea]